MIPTLSGKPMARTDIPGVIIASVPPWTLGAKAARGYIFKKGPPWMANRGALSSPQLKACLALATAATGLYGTRGKLPYKGVSMPAVAVKVAGAVPKGVGVHGGMSRADRARARHEAAGASISALQSLIAAKGG